MASFGNLPSDLILSVALFIDRESDWENYSLVCKRFNKLLSDPYSFAAFHILFANNHFSEETKYYLYGERNRNLTIELTLWDKKEKKNQYEEELEELQERADWHNSEKQGNATRYNYEKAEDKWNNQGYRQALFEELRDGRNQTFTQFHILLDEDPYINEDPVSTDRMVKLTSGPITCKGYIFPSLIAKQTGKLMNVHQISYFVKKKAGERPFSKAKNCHGPSSFYTAPENDIKSLPVQKHMNLFALAQRRTEQKSWILTMRTEYRRGTILRSTQWDPVTRSIIQQNVKSIPRYSWAWGEGTYHLPFIYDTINSKWDGGTGIKIEEDFLTNDTRVLQQWWDRDTGILTKRIEYPKVNSYNRWGHAQTEGMLQVHMWDGKTGERIDLESDKAQTVAPSTPPTNNSSNAQEQQGYYGSCRLS